MRIRISDEGRLNFFTELERQGLGVNQIAKLSGVTERTVRNWRSGKYTVPIEQHRRMSVFLNGQGMPQTETLPDWWNNKEAGRKGHAAQVDEHGQLGTQEGRRLGGTTSYERRKDKSGDIFELNTILEAKKGVRLAELTGILIGDGCLIKYQMSVALSSLVDLEYTRFVAQLIEGLFGIRPTISNRSDSNCILITVSSKSLVEFLNRKGILTGNKIKQNLDIPGWILQDESYAIACLRGVFDTDGCIFQERHKIKNKVYSYPRIAYVSASSYLRVTIRDVLFDLGFSPKIRNNRSVNLESFTDVSKYIKIIGSSNPKHVNRFHLFGGVA